MTLGDKFADPSSKVVFRLGFMLKKFKDEDCLKNLAVKIDYKNSTQLSGLNDFKTIDYVYKTDPEDMKDDTANKSITFIERTFGWLDILEARSNFYYSVLYKGEIIKGPYDFHVNLSQFEKAAKANMQNAFLKLLAKTASKEAVTDAMQQEKLKLIRMKEEKEKLKEQLENKYYKGKVMKLKDDNELRIISYGDQDVSKGEEVISNLEKQNYDLLMLLGDYAYDIHESDGITGDRYFAEIEPLMTKNPVIIIPGNHEFCDDFKFFESRYVFPRDKLGSTHHYFHFVIDKTLFIQVNFDYIPFIEGGMKTIVNYIEKVMEFRLGKYEIKNKFFNCHRPLLCTDFKKFGSNSECKTNIWRYKPIYDLLIKYEFTTIFSSHMHYYERLQPSIGYEINNEGPFQIVAATGGNDQVFEYVDLPNAQIRASNFQLIKGYVATTIDKEYKTHFKFIRAINNEILDEYVYGEKVHEDNSITITGITAGVFIVCLAILIVIMYKTDHFRKSFKENVEEEIEDTPDVELHPEKDDEDEYKISRSSHLYLVLLNSSSFS